jgi:hypothetical protein
MPATTQRRTTPYETRMLEMADRLFTEFDDLPVGTVFRAIGAVRLSLREQDVLLPDADQVERLVRDRLREPAALAG